VSNLRRRLQKLECHRREEQSYAPMPGEARRLLEQKLDAVRLRTQAAIDCGECEEPGVAAEQVAETLHALLEENRIRRKEYERRSAVRGWARP
jgi:hypothetical protein